MFLIMGINQGEKKLKFDQLLICKCCGKYGHLEIFMTYTYFMLFFIPIIKWNKRYYVRMSCCSGESQLSEDLGKSIEKGERMMLDLDRLEFTNYRGAIKFCSYCDFSTDEDYQFCPKCGSKI